LTGVIGDIEIKNHTADTNIGNKNHPADSDTVSKILTMCEHFSSTLPIFFDNTFQALFQQQLY